MSVATSCGSVKLRPLSKILDGATLGNSFKEMKLDSLHLSMHSLSHLDCFGNSL